MLVSAKALVGAAALLLVAIPVAAADAPIPAPADFSFTAMESECEKAQVPQGSDAKERTRRGVLGWLYKYTRNIDLERAGGSRLPGFLRSPLLGSLPVRSENCDALPSLDEPATCAVVALDPGSDGERMVTVPLPQLGVTTPASLADRIHERLAHGEWISLRTNRAETMRFDRHKVRYVEAEACRKDA